MRRRTARTGFTLLEILVAVVIFAGAVAVLSRLVTLGLDNADYAKLQAEGLLLIENRFAEIDAAMDEESGDSGGDMFPGWTTQMAEEPAGGDFLYRITVTAKHTTGASVAMTRFYFDQEEAETAASQANSSSSSSGSSTSSSSSGSSSAGGS